MSLQVTGKNIETSRALQDYIADKIGAVLDKYIGPELGGHVRIEKERGRFRTACSVRLRTGLMVEAQGDAADAYGSVDNAVEHLEKRVRRYKRRLKNHHAGESQAAARESAARDFQVSLSADNEVSVDEPEAPLIVAESERTLRELPVSAAVMQLDLTDDQFLVFRNAAHGGVNVVYRRNDGHIGWIDPGDGSAQGLPDGTIRTRKPKSG